MKLIPDYKRVLKQAWSIRWAMCSGLFGGVEAFLPLFSDALPRGLFALLAVLTSIGAIISRLALQKEMHDDPK
jgi:hypothetical protein